MSFEYCVLGSGSSGNSIVFWDGETTFMIDAGFSCKELARRLDLIGKDPKEVKAIFISHEHVDHSRGARVFKKRFGAEVHSTPTVEEWLYARYTLEASSDIEPAETFKLNGFSLKPFEVPHDASQTVGFIVNQGRKKVAVATDIGHMPSAVRNRFKNCDAIILESNHDIRMLKDGPYPIYLKKRILSKKGHLSNVESAVTLAAVISDRTKHVTLAHLSRENNTPAVALKEAKKHLSSISRRVKVVPADQFEVGDVSKDLGDQMDGVEIVAELMKVAATTAPKAAGQDFLEYKVVNETEMTQIEDEMFRIAKERNIPGFERDGNNLKKSSGLLLVGVKKHPGIGLDCKSCGFESCQEFNSAQRIDGDFEGPNCMLRLLDLGIALGSAAKTAQIHNVDNRIMYRVGVAARNIGLMPESMVVMGIPLSATGKSIYFDR